jgi:hypothetical protein
VRRALEAKGLLVEASRGGGWAPARVTAEVRVPSVAPRVVCSRVLAYADMC